MVHIKNIEIIIRNKSNKSKSNKSNSSQYIREHSIAKNTYTKIIAFCVS